ncbi:MAG: FAD-dependent oxidoreductase [Bacillota bacterium]
MPPRRSSPPNKAPFDAAVIGAGVVGALTARALTRMGWRVILMEARADPAGATKANSGIVHPGYDPESGTLKATLGLAGARAFEGTAAALGVPFRRIGSFMLAFDEEERQRLLRYLAQGRRRGLKGLRLLDRPEVLAREPAVNPAVVAALYSPDTAVTSPFQLAVAAAGQAVLGGAEAWREVEVTGVERDGAGFTIGTSLGKVKARRLVNAAGRRAGQVAELAGHHGLDVRGRVGEYLLLDREVGGLVKTVLYPVPTPTSKGILVMPTVHGNLLVGPNAEDVADADARANAVTRQGLAEVAAGARRLVPGLPLDRVITAFSGTRAVAGADFVIEPSDQVTGLVNLAGIASPGLSASPAIAAQVTRLLTGRVPPAEEPPSLVAKPPALGGLAAGGGRLVCRCERVTEAAVVAAIHEPFGARTVDGVKQRTRAGMGRCQGAFCGPRVVEILARELGRPVSGMTKSGAGSELFVGRTKEA